MNLRPFATSIQLRRRAAHFIVLQHNPAPSLFRPPDALGLGSYHDPWSEVQSPNNEKQNRRDVVNDYPILYPLETSTIIASIPCSRLSKNTCFAFGVSFMVMVFLISSIHTDQALFCCLLLINHKHRRNRSILLFLSPLPLWNKIFSSSFNNIFTICSF